MLRKTFDRSLVLGVAVVALTAPGVLGGPTHSDWIVAQDGSPVHKLLIEGDAKILDGTERIELFPGDGIYSGLFVNQEPGWESLDADEPPDHFILLPGSNVSLKRLSFDAGFSMYDPFSGTPILESDGSLFSFGAAPDGTFHIDLIYAGDGPIGSLYSATFQLVDPTGLQADSDPFTLGFIVAPEPATAALFALMLVPAVRRRRPRECATARRSPLRPPRAALLKQRRVAENAGDGEGLSSFPFVRGGRAGERRGIRSHDAG